MIIEQNGEGYEIKGSFRIYGTQDELIKVSAQLREGAKKVQIGWVDVDPGADIPVQTIKAWKG